jgi:PAS domain S-box-containing protein
MTSYENGDHVTKQISTNKSTFSSKWEQLKNAPLDLLISSFVMFNYMGLVIFDLVGNQKFDFSAMLPIYLLALPVWLSALRRWRWCGVLAVCYWTLSSSLLALSFGPDHGFRYLTMTSLVGGSLLISGRSDRRLRAVWYSQCLVLLLTEVGIYFRDFEHVTGSHNNELSFFIYFTSAVFIMAAIHRFAHLLQQNKLQVDNYFNQSLDLMCIAHTDGTFKRVNPAFENILGYTNGELLKKPFLSFIHPDDIAATVKGVETLSLGEKLLHFENRYRAKTGDYRVISWHCHPDTATGNLYATGRDTTQQSETERQRQLLFSKLNEAQRLAKIGSWEYQVQSGHHFGSSEQYRIFEIPEDMRGVELTAAIRSRMSEKDLAQLDELMKDSAKSGREFNLHHQIHLPEGRIKEIITIGKPVRNAEGIVTSFTGTSQDQTERFGREVESSFVMNSLGIGIWKWDIITNELEWDENMYRLYGCVPEDFNGAYDAWENSLSADTKARAVEEINAAIRGDKPFDTTFQVVHKSGKIQEIRTRAFVIRDASGKALKMWGINVDRNREAELERIMQEERSKSLHHAKLASLGEMSAGMAHEINNPMTIIIGNLSLVEKFAHDPVKLRSIINAMEKSAHRVSKIVGGLKKFSRTSDSRKLSVKSLGAIATESLNLVAANPNRNQTSVDLDVAGDSRILCDEIEIEQILINLINNAIDAVKNLPERWVRIRIFERNEKIVMQIRDSGSGIAADIRNKIFQPFFTTKPVGEGTGLGLSIAKGIVEEHRGSIDVLTEEKNTCFEIVFPKAAEAKLVA